MSPPRTRIRHKDIRVETPENPGRQLSEDAISKDDYVEADCLATDAVGDFVILTGDAVSGFIQVTKIDVTSASQRAFGMIRSKETVTRCTIQMTGIVSLAGLTPGGRYWIGTNGQVTNTLPVPGVGQTVLAQTAGIAISSTKLLLNLHEYAIKRQG